MSGDIWKEIEAKATSLEIPPATIRVWKHRGFVPGRWHLALLNAGASLSHLKTLAESAARRKSCRIDIKRRKRTKA